VNCFAQTAFANGGWQCQSPISSGNEALLWVAQSKTEQEQRLLLELARIWTAAAFASDRIVAVSGSAPEARVHDLGAYYSIHGLSWESYQRTVTIVGNDPKGEIINVRLPAQQALALIPAASSGDKARSRTTIVWSTRIETGA
jgi:hypothetical protein